MSQCLLRLSHKATNRFQYLVRNRYFFIYNAVFITLEIGIPCESRQGILQLASYGKPVEIEPIYSDPHQLSRPIQRALLRQWLHEQQG